MMGPQHVHSYDVIMSATMIFSPRNRPSSLEWLAATSECYCKAK